MRTGYLFGFGKMCSMILYRMIPLIGRQKIEYKKTAIIFLILETMAVDREPRGIQTHDLQNRNLTLYSAKLGVR